MASVFFNPFEVSYASTTFDDYETQIQHCHEQGGWPTKFETEHEMYSVYLTHGDGPFYVGVDRFCDNDFLAPDVSVNAFTFADGTGANETMAYIHSAEAWNDDMPSTDPESKCTQLLNGKLSNIPCETELQVICRLPYPYPTAEEIAQRTFEERVCPILHNGIEYVYIEDHANYESQIQSCEAIGGLPTRIESEEDLEFLTTAFNFGERVYVGVDRMCNLDDSSRNGFTFTDGTGTDESLSFIREATVGDSGAWIPWEPNNNNMYGDNTELCTELFLNDFKYLNDIACRETKPVICRIDHDLIPYKGCA